MATRNRTELFDEFRRTAPRPINTIRIVLPPEWVDHVDNIRDYIQSINDKLQKLDNLYSKKLREIFDADGKKYDAQIEILSAQITKDFHAAENHLKRIAMTKSIEKINPTVAERRIRLNAMRNCALRLQDASKQFRNIRADALRQMEQRNNITQIIPVDDEDETTSLQMQELRDRTNTRTKEIHDLAQSVQELADMFKQLNVLVLDQGSVIDRIDYNVENALSNVQVANIELKKAEKYSRSTRSWACICILILLMIILVIILIYKHQN